jgi:hypothetical protein
MRSRKAIHGNHADDQVLYFMDHTGFGMCDNYANIQQLHQPRKLAAYLTKYGKSERVIATNDAQRSHSPVPKETSIPRGTPGCTFREYQSDTRQPGH